MPELENYEGREQGFVKHAIIEKYLETFAIKISSKWDNIVYIDAFAGPWENVAEDLSDTSFCIALKQLHSGITIAKERFTRDVLVQAYLVEKNKKAFRKLSEFSREQKTSGFEVTCLQGSFEDRLPELQSQINQSSPKASFLFALIDPKGWTGLSMKNIAPLFKNRSTEVLVNVMTSFIHRFADVEHCSDSYERYFGRSDVRDSIKEADSGERDDAVVREYCRSLRQFCEFKYVSSAIILEPNKTDIKYFMVYGTNSAMGIKVFKEAEAHAASLQDQIKKEKALKGQRLLFDDDTPPAFSASLREKYRCIMKKRIRELFNNRNSIPYVDVFCKAMAIPLVTEDDLQKTLDRDPDLHLKLDGQRRKKPSIDIEKYDDRVVRNAHT